MKIVHISLTSPYYNENMAYQDNMISHYNVLDGHETTVIANLFIWNDKGQIEKVPEQDELLPNGVRLIRIDYDKIINPSITSKIRKCSKLYNLLELLNPDVILHHAVSAHTMVTVAKYKKMNPNIKFYADNHAEYLNSAQGWISLNFLHKIIYKRYIKKALPYIEKIFYISVYTKQFVQELYGVPEEKLEFLPLGGTIVDDKQYTEKRSAIREELKLSDEDILIVHSGKMDKFKRTADLLKALKTVDSDKLRLVLIGSMTDDVRNECESLIEQDERVIYAGWKSSDQLCDYLCGGDLYAQPGSQSATLVTAMCCRCPIMAFPYESFKAVLHGNHFYIETVEDMANVLKALNHEDLDNKTVISHETATNILDYKVISARIYR